MAVLEAAHVRFTGECNIHRPVSFLAEAVARFETSRIEVCAAVFGMIDGYAAVNHQVVSNSVLEREIMPLEVRVAVSAMAVVEPVFRFDCPFLDRLKNEGLVDVILAVSINGSSA